MVQEVRSPEASQAADYIRFWAAGQRAKGEFHCADCGYGVTVHTELPSCPMCA